jgi:hypothetical protein
MKEIHHCMYSVTHLFSGTHVSSSLNFFLFHHSLCYGRGQARPRLPSSGLRPRMTAWSSLPLAALAGDGAAHAMAGSSSSVVALVGVDAGAARCMVGSNSPTAALLGSRLPTPLLHQTLLWLPSQESGPPVQTKLARPLTFSCEHASMGKEEACQWKKTTS